MNYDAVWWHRKRWYFVTALIAVFFFTIVGVAVAQTTTPVASGPDDWRKYFPPPEQWQGYCILFGPVVIATTMRFVNEGLKSAHRTLLSKGSRKFIANGFVFAAAVVGLALDHKLDSFTPTFAGVTYLVIGVHNSYDKLWMGIPGLSHIINFIDPEASA